MTRRGIAVLSVTLLAAACAARTPRLPEPGDRVRAWTASPPAGERVVAVGEVDGFSADTLTLRTNGDPPMKLAWSAIDVLEIDATRRRTALRVVACAMLPLGAALIVSDLVGDERDADRAAFMSFYAALFADGCFFPGPDWRAGRIPRTALPGSQP